MNAHLFELAQQLRDQLVQKQSRLVLVESCTGGWLASSLAALPGISQWWCGSLVVYRSESKAIWLGIDRQLLKDPAIGPVSPQVTLQLAQRAILHTPEATLGLAVTGDIGPGVAPEKDGRVYCALCSEEDLSNKSLAEARQAQTRLKCPAPLDAQDIARRAARLEEASAWVFARAIEWLQ